MNPEWQNLINGLKAKGVLKKPRIISAFEAIDRTDFVLDEMKDTAYLDEALPILEGQTISQPYTVAFMLDLLDPRPGEKILDVGAGSGWQTSLLAHIVSNPPTGGGKVYAMEIMPQLCIFGRNNVEKYDFIQKGVVKWICGDASQEAPFDPVNKEVSNGVDKIIVAAASRKMVPQIFFEQLKPGGKLVCPIDRSVWLFEKRENGEISSEEFPGFIFVPFQNA